MLITSHARLARLLLALMFMTGGLSACTDTRSPPEDIAKNPAAAMPYARAILGKMPEAARTAFKAKVKSENERLDNELKATLNTKGPGLLDRMAVYVQARKSQIQEFKRQISIENAQLAQIDPENDDYNGNETNGALDHAADISAHRSAIAQAVLLANVQQKYLRRAIATSPVLTEANHRQDEAEGSEVWGTIPYYINEMRKEPCLFNTAEAETAATISLRGIELGMTRKKAIDALCANENGEVRITSQTHDLTYTAGNIQQGARLLAWDAYQKGGVAYAPDYLGVNTWLARPENTAAINGLASSYVKMTRFCLHCAGTGHEDDNTLTLQYAPDGTVIAIKRVQRFNDNTPQDANGRPLLGNRIIPQPLNAVVDPLRTQLGTPSFVFRNLVAWVFPDGETPLQPEIWSTYQSLDGKQKQIRLNNASFDVSAPLDPGGPAFMSLYKALSGRQTPATYCVSKYAYDGLDSNWPLAAVYADRFGTRAYDHAAAAPGETNRCGVVVYAVMDVSSDGDNDTYINDNTPVYGVTVTVVNASRLSAQYKREAQTVIDRMTALAANPAKPVPLRK
ncbi:MAG: hypothetical protein QM647_06540 [Asticcacaulis sp.]|uniref:hypothetical protein n=1 Tax=Asticcacaulis sp. TaxID=1872648 RepID=UPI0039E4DB08